MYHLDAETEYYYALSIRVLARRLNLIARDYITARGTSQLPIATGMFKVMAITNS